MLAIGDEIELYRFLPDRASSTIMLKNPSRGVACGQLKKRRPGQKGLTASMQHEQSSHSMHAMLQAESRSQALIRFAQRMQAKGRAATNMSKARGKKEFERMLIPAGKGCAAYTAKGIAAQEATGLPVMTQDPVLNQWLNPLFQMSSTSPSDYAADGDVASGQAHDTEGQMCDLEGQTQAGSPSAPFPMLALDLVSSNAPAEGGSVVITDSQKAEALLDAQAQKAAAHLSAHIKQSPALARAQQQQPPVQTVRQPPKD
ncbi:hypothetical protein WJX79_010882 [Trebouxia sp. C0005]